MEMDKFLSDCTIIGNFKEVPVHLQSTINTFQYQCHALGIQVENDLSLNSDVNFPFKFISSDRRTQENLLSFWSDDPLRQGSESVIQAATGLMSVHGRSIGGIDALNAPYLSSASAVLTLLGCIATAIGHRRGLNSRGFQTSMVSAGLLCVGQYLAGATVNEYAENIPPGVHDHSQRPPFCSEDGVLFELETLSPEPWRRFWSALGISQEDMSKGWQSFLQRYAKATSYLPRTLISKISSCKFKDIELLASESGVAVCRQRTLLERSTDRDISILLERGPWQLRPEVINNEIYKDSSENILNLDTSNNFITDQTKPLSGLTVIESCRRIQGPIAGHLLALLGARVVRIEPPGGDPLRGMPPLAGDCSARFDALNHLKEVREIDIKTPAGRAEVLSLVSTADVFIHNWAPGKAKQLQLDHEHLKKVNPDIVYNYAGGWGILDNDVHYPGTDFTVQAYSGLASELSHNNKNNGGTLYTALDVLGGIISAQGTTLGLFRKFFNNQGCRVDTSLLGSATLLTQPIIKSIREKHQKPEFQKGRLFKTLDGYIILEFSSSNELIPLLDEINLTVKDLEQSNIDEKLEKILEDKNAQEWLFIFEKHNIPCSQVIESLEELPKQPRFKENFQTSNYSRVTTPWRFK
ncbi:CoA transferase [Microbulbifer sp. JMSA008]|uniref:CoA transferase n=1 Tax=Microbulbifer sp. JMSA008 TaxID=3243373 RepID=UPI004039EF07